jgi:hypothetical protein
VPNDSGLGADWKVQPVGVACTNPLRSIMEYQVIEQIPELFQTLIAPQLDGIKGDIRALDAKFDVNQDGRLIPKSRVWP